MHAIATIRHVPSITCSIHALPDGKASIMCGIKTRIFCLADTHGQNLETIPRECFDVVLHCGDLTDNSRLREFQSAIQLLKQLDAPLKLVIPGNHDASLDPDSCRQTGPIWDLFREAKAWGIKVLPTGMHRLHLGNGSLLSIYANPYTPSAALGGAFQYLPGCGWSRFRDVEAPVDVVMTHGPPHGILDWNFDARHAGCPGLLDAIIHTKPLLHVFGHIHEDWGAKYVVWDRRSEDRRIRKSMSYTHMNWNASQRYRRCHRLGYDSTSHCQEGEMPLNGVKRNATLFVNAAVKGGRGEEGDSQHIPWVVELELPSA